jgi:hypothetical protein
VATATVAGAMVAKLGSIAELGRQAPVNILHRIADALDRAYHLLPQALELSTRDLLILQSRHAPDDIGEPAEVCSHGLKRARDGDRDLIGLRALQDAGGSKGALGGVNSRPSATSASARV